ncbi:MAG TPA: alpha/beta fold hydrolase, partial [Sphingobacteriaceae bacterium]
MFRYKLILVFIILPFITRAQKLVNGISQLNINGIRHWVKVAGAEHQTVPMVIIHGGPGGNHYVFERTAGAELEKFATVIYYEQRGSGRSDRPEDGKYTVPLMVSDLDAIRKNLGLKQIVPLGYSFGASLALEYTLAHPAEVKGLILESFATLQDSSVLLSQLANFYSQAHAGTRPKMDSILRSNSSLADKNMAFWNLARREDVIRFLFRDPAQGRKVFGMWQESGIGNTGEVMKALMKEQRPVNLYDDAHRVKSPVLIVAGVYDRNGALPAAIRIKEEIPRSEIRFFERSAHFPDVEETAEFTRVVKNWYSALE